MIQWWTNKVSLFLLFTLARWTNKVWPEQTRQGSGAEANFSGAGAHSEGICDKRIVPIRMLDSEAESEQAKAEFDRTGSVTRGVSFRSRIRCQTGAGGEFGPGRIRFMIKKTSSPFSIKLRAQSTERMVKNHLNYRVRTGDRFMASIRIKVIYYRDFLWKLK